jgi:hypothetical protein
MKWTLLSPTRQKLAALRQRWIKEVTHAGLRPGDHAGFLELFEETPSLHSDDLGEQINVEHLAGVAFKEDTAEPNGSSIAMLFEYEGRTLLLAGDAHPSVLQRSLTRFASERDLQGPVSLDALKVSHHGSHKNTSPQLLECIDCRCFLFSSDGKKFSHPSAECIARIVHRRCGVVLHFNYDTKVNEIWKSSSLQRKYGFEAVYPLDGGDRLEWKTP